MQGLEFRNRLAIPIKERRFYHEAGIKTTRNGKAWYDYVEGIENNGYKTSLVEYGRMRWKIENEGFNTQKRQGYHLEHQFSRDCQAQKCRYYLIQIGHMTAQVLEAWEKLWKNVKQSREQKHRRLLESFKNDRLKDLEKELEKKFQVRFI